MGGVDSCHSVKLCNHGMHSNHLDVIMALAAFTLPGRDNGMLGQAYACLRLWVSLSQKKRKKKDIIIEACASIYTLQH